jgi:hypothetical protein
LRSGAAPAEGAWIATKLYRGPTLAERLTERTGAWSVDEVAALVGGREAVEQGQDHRGDLVHAPRPGALREALGEGGAAVELRRDPCSLGGSGPGGVHPNHRGVRNRLRRKDFAQKPPPRGLVGVDPGGEHLEGHLAGFELVPGAPHRRRGAAPEALAQNEAPRDPVAGRAVLVELKSGGHWNPA